jgi:FkbM family methyltransferase
MKDPGLELLHLSAVPGPPFVLVAQSAGDRHFVPFVRHHRIWEPAETLVLQRMLRPGMRVVDVGAHVGYYSVLFSRAVGAAGEVIAFEPEPRNRQLLQANLLLNDCGNVRVDARAVSRQTGRATLHLSRTNFGDHRLQPVAGRESIEVETVALDELLHAAIPDFIKMDTQGAEPAVLAGMRGLIERGREVLACLIEFAPGLLARDGLDLAGFASLLEALGALVYHPKLVGREVRLRHFSPLRAGLTELAARLAAEGGEDASADLLVFFSAAAQTLWLERFRGGSQVA